jgi:hypothetical protein
VEGGTNGALKRSGAGVVTGAPACAGAYSGDGAEAVGASGRATTSDPQLRHFSCAAGTIEEQFGHCFTSRYVGIMSRKLERRPATA